MYLNHKHKQTFVSDSYPTINDPDTQPPTPGDWQPPITDFNLYLGNAINWVETGMQFEDIKHLPEVGGKYYLLLKNWKNDTDS